MLTRIGRTAHGKPWDEAADAELRSRVEAGELLPAIAKAMGRTQEAVRSRANIMHVPVRSSLGRGRRALTQLPLVDETLEQ
ncbi:hypothetical protein [Sphingomonas jatrophae]|uniref:GcrA cell cycle regulator n=1 Tax=Sphingomonas jatrophae TaxID=1166337 RepID=A0A1I6JVW1_9SPHN|nr:hypothetical protein [Sphingomonas jatrophae]SFR83134.1 hypothetical protein SAMN05192580_0969 [Sphingomonas jatrophae]